MKTRLIFFLLLFSNAFLQAQEVGGFWKGSLTFAGGCFAQNNIELQIKMVGDGLYGDSYHYMDVKNYIRKEISGSYDPETKKLIVQEGIVTEQALVDRCAICIKRFQLTYRKDANAEFLEGYWTGKLQGTNIDCGTGGTIILSRIVTPTFKDESIPVIKVDTGEIKLQFYDNGTIDGDSITVKVNKQVVLTHEKLGDKPVTATVRISLATPVVVVEMMADNEGTIPPNTALLIVTAPNLYHRLYMSSTKEKSAKLRFVYDKEAAKNQPAIGKK